MTIGNINPNSPVNNQIHTLQKSKFKRVMAKIWRVVKIIFLVLAAVGLYLTNPSLFAIGFMVGIIWPQKIQGYIDKVNIVIKKMPWVVAPVVAVAAFLSLPVTTATASLLISGHIGSKLSILAQKKAGGGTTQTPSVGETG